MSFISLSHNISGNLYNNILLYTIIPRDLHQQLVNQSASLSRANYLGSNPLTSLSQFFYQMETTLAPLHIDLVQKLSAYIFLFHCLCKLVLCFIYLCISHVICNIQQINTCTDTDFYFKHEISFVELLPKTWCNIKNTVYFYHDIGLTDPIKWEKL